MLDFLIAMRVSRSFPQPTNGLVAGRRGSYMTYLMPGGFPPADLRRTERTLALSLFNSIEQV